MGVKYSGMSDLGKVRELNEDSFYLPSDDSLLFIVADGMGGHNAGEVASSKAVELISSRIKEKIHSVKDNKEVLYVMDQAVKSANFEIFDAAHINAEYSGMGTTVDVGYIKDDILFFVHVGDSRIYRVRNKKITQLTQDHSVVAMMVKNGTITEEEARNHPQKNCITRALGTEQTIKTDTSATVLREGDVILMCSDGLTAMVEDKRILEIIETCQDTQECVQSLLDEANENGGADNITALIIKK